MGYCIGKIAQKQVSVPAADCIGSEGPTAPEEQITVPAIASAGTNVYDSAPEA